jgi:hypothetical protein
MAKPPAKLPATTTNVPPEIQDVVALINSGQVASWSLHQLSDGTTKFRGTTGDGNSAIMIEKFVVGTYSKTVTETTARAASIEDRRQQVKALHNQGLNQTEISARIIRSQKTVSNDLKALRDDGEIS